MRFALGRTRHRGSRGSFLLKLLKRRFENGGSYRKFGHFWGSLSSLPLAILSWYTAIYLLFAICLLFRLTQVAANLLLNKKGIWKSYVQRQQKTGKEFIFLWSTICTSGNRQSVNFWVSRSNKDVFLAGRKGVCHVVSWTFLPSSYLPFMPVFRGFGCNCFDRFFVYIDIAGDLSRITSMLGQADNNLRGKESTTLA